MKSWLESDAEAAGIKLGYGRDALSVDWDEIIGSYESKGKWSFSMARPLRPGSVLGIELRHARISERRGDWMHVRVTEVLQ